MKVFRILMSNKVDNFDNIKEQAKHGIPANTPQRDIPVARYSIIIIILREYLTDKRLENNCERNADDMDIGGIGDNHEKEEEPVSQSNNHNH